MAKIRAVAITEQTTTTASLVCSMPEHEPGDLLVVFANKDGNSAIADPGGIWTSQRNQASTGAYGRLLTTVATTSSHTLTLTAATDTWFVVIVSVRNVHASTPVDMTAVTGSDSTTMPFAGNTGSTTADNCLLLHGISGDIGFGAFCKAGFVNLVNGDAGANTMSVAYTYQKTAGAIATPAWYGGVVSGVDTRAFVIAIADDGNESEVDPYTDTSVVTARVVDPLVAITVLNSNAWEPSALSLADVGGKTAVFDLASALGDSGVVPYIAAVRLTPVADTSGANLSGSELTFGSAEDFSSGYLVSTFGFTTPRDWVDLGLASNGGIQFVLQDGGDYTSWMVGAKGSKTTSSYARGNLAIQVAQAQDTSWASSGAIAPGAVDSVLLLCQNRFGAVNMYFSMLLNVVAPMKVLGGTLTAPLDFDSLDVLINNAATPYPFFQRSGSAALLWIPLQFGGTDPVFLDVTLRTFQFPRRADGVNYLDWHVDEGEVGFEFYPLAGDSIKLSSCVFTSDSPYYWRFNASSSASATLDFSGTSVAGAVVTLQDVTTFSGMAFVRCDEIVTNEAPIEDSTIKNGVGASGLLITSTNDSAALARLTFQNNHDGYIGHALRITAAGAHTLDGHTFTGGGVDRQSFQTQDDVTAAANPVLAAFNALATWDALHLRTTGGPTESGGTVLSWPDANGGAAATLPGDGPDYVADPLGNGSGPSAYLTNSYSSEFYGFESDVAVSTSQDFTAFIAARFADNDGIIISESTTDGFLFRSGASLYLFDNATVEYEDSVGTGIVFRFIVVRESGTLSVYIDGVVGGTTIGSSAQEAAALIFGSGGSYENAMNGDIFCFGGVAGVALTGTDIDDLDDYIANEMTAGVFSGGVSTVTIVGHGYSTGDAVYYQDQGGSLSVGLTDGNLYYVRAVSSDDLSFHPTLEDAVNDTNGVSLTVGASNETHWIYSAKADVFVDVSGATTLNIVNGGDTPTIREADGAVVTVVNAVTVRITVLDAVTGDPIEDARVLLRTAAGGPVTAGTSIFNTLTDSSGVVENTAYDFGGSQPVIGRVRKGTSSPLYKNAPISGTIGSTGLDVTIFMVEDE